LTSGDSYDSLVQTIMLYLLDNIASKGVILDNTTVDSIKELILAQILENMPNIFDTIFSNIVECASFKQFCHVYLYPVHAPPLRHLTICSDSNRLMPNMFFMGVLANFVSCVFSRGTTCSHLS